ncbi:MAG TPA: hypothetical protein VMF55_09900 [Solirubrobacterales bacterium]|nr:hypothetical protein [Solirubrobacterales bacterium]
MKKLIPLLSVLALVAAFCGTARADFGLSQFEVSLRNRDGSPATQAGSHPYAMDTLFRLNAHAEGHVADQELRTLTMRLPVGVVGNVTSQPTCSAVAFRTKQVVPGHEAPTSCPDSAAVGAASAYLFGSTESAAVGAVYNLDPPPGKVAALGFQIAAVPVVIDLGIDPVRPNEVVATVSNVAQSALLASFVEIWGEPGDPSHDPYRGRCIDLNSSVTLGDFRSLGSCPTSATAPFLTMPRSCGPGVATYSALSWPGELASGSAELAATTGCNRLGFAPSITAAPTIRAAGSSSGLDFGLGAETQGLTSTGALAPTDIKDVAVTLPEGFVANPSLAEGLAACGEDQLARETAAGAPGSGCPEAAKIGTVEVETPLLGETLQGEIYTATPYRNLAGDSLLAAYVVIKDPELGLLVTQAVKISPDPATGRIVATAEALPQLPFSRFRLHFRGGERGPLTTPPSCGAYRTEAVLTPWSGGPSVTSDSSFEVTTGPAGGSCPSAPAALAPTFEAGTVSPLAGTFSPFVLRLERSAGSARLSSLETTLPEGVLAKLRGATECPEAQIAAARARELPQAGQAELAAPSCPSSSEVGSVTVGAGSGAQTRVSGRAYLAGPYKGAPLSLVVVTPAVTGPFDLGTVVVRNALYVDPFSARVRAVSDPLPSILQGIPLDLRSISIDLTRPQFTLNPTSCEPSSVSGSVGSPFGQVVALGDRFQVGGCGGLGFTPKLALSLTGATKRTGHPALKAVVTFPDAGSSANVSRAQVSLPHSEFLDQRNLDKVCGQADLYAGTCPKRSIYGQATAWSPLLDKPLRGPVYLGVGFGYKLPALVAELDGQIRVLLKGRIDTDRAGGIRTTFASVPDAPISRFVLQMRGGRKYGLLENSTDICAAAQRPTARFEGHNGKGETLRPRISKKCGAAKGRGAARR